MQSRFAVQRSHTVPCGPREPIRTANDPVEAETDARRPPASAKGFVLDNFSRKRGPAGWGAAAGVQFNQGFAEIKEAGVLVRVPARIGSGWQPPAPKPPRYTRSSSRTSPPAKSRYAYVVRTNPVRSPGGRPRGRPRRVPTPATAVPDGADISQAAPDTRPATLGGLVMPLAAL